MALSDINIRIGAEITQFQAGLRRAERELQRSADKFNQLGNNLSLAVSLPLAAAGAAAFKFAAGFETATVKIENLVGVQGAELDELKEKFRTLGPVVGKTQQELADAALFIAGAGLRGAAGLEALEQSAKASAIGLGEQTALAKVAGAAVAAYGETNITAGESVDKLLGIVKAGNAEAADLAPVLGRVLPIAAQLGVSFDEVGANIATFTRLGINAEGAVDGLKSALTNVLKPSEQAKKALGSIGLTSEQLRESIAKNGLAATLQELTVAFGDNVEGLGAVFGDVQGLTAVLATAGAQGDTYAQVLKDIQQSAGGVDAAFAKTAETAEFKLKKAFAGLSAAGTEIGGILLPVVVDLANAVVPLVQGFASLDSGAQKLVVGFGLAAAAAGPLFSLIGGSIETYKTARSAILSFGKAAEVSQTAFTTLAPAIGNTGAALRAAGVAWRALDTVAKATVIGAALAIVVALGAAFYKLSDGMSIASKTQAALNEVTATAEKNIVAERLEAERLISVINSNTASYDEKLAAQKRLQAISPEFFSNLSLEEKGHNANTEALKRYTGQLLQAARAQAAQEKIVELERERLDILQKIGPQQAKIFAANQALPGLGSAVAGASNLFNFGTITLEKRQQEIDAQIKALGGIATEASIATAKLQQQATTTVGAPLGITGAPLPSGTAPKAAKPVKFDGFKDVASGLTVINDAAILTNGELNKLSTEILPVLSENQTAFALALGYSSENFYTARDAALAHEEALARVATQMQTVAALGEAVGNAIFQASADGAASLADLAKAGANAARSFIAQQIAMGVAAQVRSALGTGLAGLLLAPIAGGAAAALFNRLIPKFADGGIISGPTFGLMGEYPGASTNPEVVAPLSKLKGMLQDAGGGAVAVYGRLSGADILISSERSDTRRALRRGY
jgi:TP901 family phage tail tape measure protein